MPLVTSPALFCLFICHNQLHVTQAREQRERGDDSSRAAILIFSAASRATQARKPPPPPHFCASILLRKYTAAAIAATAGAGWTGAQADGAHKGSDARQQQPGGRLPRRALAV